MCLILMGRAAYDPFTAMFISGGSVGELSFTCDVQAAVSTMPVVSGSGTEESGSGLSDQCGMENRSNKIFLVWKLNESAIISPSSEILLGILKRRPKVTVSKTIHILIVPVCCSEPQRPS